MLKPYILRRIFKNFRSRFLFLNFAPYNISRFIYIKTAVSSCDN